MASRLSMAAISFAVLLSVADRAEAQSYSSFVLSGNPTLYWNFNEAGNTDPAIDLVGSETGDNLAAQGNATRVASGSTSGGVNLGRAASFDNTAPTKFFSNTLTPPTNPDAWALEMWIRPQSGTDPGTRSHYIIEAQIPGGPNTPGILFDYVGSGRDNNVEIFRAGQRTGNAGPAIPNDVWSHLVIGYLGGANDRADFYLNGALAGSATGIAIDMPFGTDTIAVGNSTPGHPDFDHFNGQLDEIALYDLTGSTVPAIEAKLQAIAAHYSFSIGGVVGDADIDGDVDGDDFIVISNNLFTNQTPGAGGDLDLSGLVDFTDFRIWKNAVNPAIAAQYAIPEPSCAILVALGVLGFAYRRRVS